MKKTIRVANVGDIDTIFDIRTRVRENHLSREQLADIGVTPDAIREVIALAPCIWIAEVDGIPVGFSMANLEDACVFAAFVLPDYEGLGLGRLLMLGCALVAGLIVGLIIERGLLRFMYGRDEVLMVDRKSVV